MTIHYFLRNSSTGALVSFNPLAGKKGSLAENIPKTVSSIKMFFSPWIALLTWFFSWDAGGIKHPLPLSWAKRNSGSHQKNLYKTCGLNSKLVLIVSKFKRKKQSGQTRGCRTRIFLMHHFFSVPCFPFNYMWKISLTDIPVAVFFIFIFIFLILIKAHSSEAST